jgi:small-conductance mechanosensitive channel
MAMSYFSPDLSNYSLFVFLQIDSESGCIPSIQRLILGESRKISNQGVTMEWIRPWITPLSLLVVGVLLGFFVNSILLRSISKLSARTTWAWDNILASALSGFPLFWGFLAGLYGVIQFAPVSRQQLDIGTKVLIVLLILSITILIARVATGIAVDYSSRKEGRFPSATILSNLTRAFVYVLGFLTIFYTFGINITPALTALGIGGLAVALALQDTLSNFFAGLQIVASKQISSGDYVKLASGEEGYVADITWRNTTLRGLPNNMVVIPNSKLASEIFTNYYLPEKEMAVLMQVGVSYDSDLVKVEKVTIDVANEVMKEVTGAVPGFQTFIRYHTFDDFSINFSVILRGKEFTDQYLVKHEFIKRLHDRYKKEQIDIPFPIRTVLLNQKK